MFAGLMRMNMIGAEGRATCGLLGAGLTLHAPCRHVRVAHWHCEDKTHAINKIRWDRGAYFDAINAFIEAGHAEYGVRVNSDLAMTFDTNTCARGDCGGIDYS